MPQEQSQTQNQETDSLDEMDGLRAQLANANKQATLNDHRAALAEKQIETLRSKFQVLEEDNKKLLTDDVSALKAGYEERAKQTETSTLKTMFQMAFVAAGGDSKRAADVFKFCGDRLGFIDGEPAFLDENGLTEWIADNGGVRKGGLADFIENLKKDAVVSMFFSSNQGGQGKEENVRYISKAQSMDAAWLKRQGLANNYLHLRSEGKIQVSDELALADNNVPHQSYGGSRVVPRSIMTNPSAMRRLADEMGVDFLKAVQQGKIEFEAS